MMNIVARKALGFTLLEVLIALAIFAVTALALMNIAINHTQSVRHNQLRTQAHFVAMNVAAEINIQNKWLTGIVTEQRTEQGEQWKIVQTVKNTISPNVQQIDIQIFYLDPDQASADNQQGVSSLSIFNRRQTEGAS